MEDKLANYSIPKKPEGAPDKPANGKKLFLIKYLKVEYMNELMNEWMNLWINLWNNKINFSKN